MMTRFEAQERAKRIWGADNVRQVTPNSVGKWFVEVSTDARGHFLDGNGHTTCHPECAKLEDCL